MVPYSLRCGGFQNNLQEVIVWFSGGDTRSVLHYDALGNIVCLLDGKKKLVLIDKMYNDMITADGFVEVGTYSLVDVDSVDPIRFPGVLNAPWYQINMEKGDSVFIPYKSDFLSTFVGATDVSRQMFAEKSICGDRKCIFDHEINNTVRHDNDQNIKLPDLDGNIIHNEVDTDKDDIEETNTLEQYLDKDGMKSENNSVVDKEDAFIYQPNENIDDSHGDIGKDSSVGLINESTEEVNSNRRFKAKDAEKVDSHDHDEF